MAGMTSPSHQAPSAETRSALFEQLAERLRTRGYRYPEAAAAALAARGDSGLGFDEFCSAKGFIPDLWRQAEEGWLALEAVQRLLGAGTPELVPGESSDS
jgi:hypothetical protein